MGKSGIEKRNQSVEDFFNEVQGYLLGKIPFGDDIGFLLNARNNIKKERLLRFFEKFRDELQHIYGKPLDADDITSEEFLDVMESIMMKVQVTKSEIKLDYFKNILLNQIINKSANEILTNKIIQTVDELNELQLLLLNSIKNYEDGLPTIYDIVVFFTMNDVHIRISRDDELTTNVESPEVIESGIFVYFLEELVNKGIIVEHEIDGYAEPRLQELKREFGSYINRKVERSGTKIVYKCSDYGELLYNFILI